jgi:Tfp pilus assembly protein PilF
VSATGLRRAVDLLAEGDWEAAHTIVQDDPSSLAAWLHGIVHLLEGDTSNARYWYRQASRPFPETGDVRAEIEAARAAARSSGD